MHPSIPIPNPLAHVHRKGGIKTDYPWLAHYEEGVPYAVDVPPILLQDMLAETAARLPSHIALRLVLKYLPLGIPIGSTLTYTELVQASDRFAAALQGLGIGKGDRVAIMLPNIPQFVIAYYGALKAGAILVNINPTYTSFELRHTLHDSGARVIVMLSGLVGRLAPIRDEVAIEHVIACDIGDSVGLPLRWLVERQMRASGMMKQVAYDDTVHHFATLLQDAPATPTPVDISPDDVALFQFTGGTTGVAKAAMLTHRNLVANCVQMDAWFTRVNFGTAKWLLALPVFHVYGMSAGLLLGVRFGAEIIMVPDPRNTTHVLEVIQHQKISTYIGVPAMYIALINHPRIQEFDLSSIESCFSGGSALPVEVAQKFDALTGGKLVEGFGMTESSPLALGNPIYGESRPASVGVPFPSTVGAICALQPDEQGKYALLGPGEEGELILKGPQVMKGYWKMPEETAKTIDADGWLHTGDIAKMDEDGYFYIVDRKKDLIIASGFNIVPREVEEVLFQFPKIMDAAVAGVPDPKRGETVKAFVVLKDGQATSISEIRAFCKERLAPYKVPTDIKFLKELPKTQAGKVLRRQLVLEDKQEQGVA